MIPQAFIAHRSPGRVRLRIDSKRQDAPYFKSLHQRLGSLKGTREVETNSFTGSVLILHEAGLPLGELGSFAREEGLFALTESPRSSPKPQPTPEEKIIEKVPRLAQTLDAKIVDLSDGKLDLRSAAFLGLVGLGLYQVARGRVLPVAISLFDDALGVLNHTSQKGEEKNRLGSLTKS